MNKLKKVQKSNFAITAKTYAAVALQFDITKGMHLEMLDIQPLF